MPSESPSNARASRTLAQWYCLLVGGLLTLIGILGFIADRSFETGGDVSGGSFLGFEVNGWHNLVHLGSGIVLLAAANTRPTAKTVAIGFGFVYAIVALWGIIDGSTVLGVIPVNAADNVLHVILAALGIATGMLSPTTKREQLAKQGGRGHKRLGGGGGGGHGAREGDENPGPSGAAEPRARHDAAEGTSEAGRFAGSGSDNNQLPEQNKITRTRS
jgi:hypothetical protein